MTEKDDLKIFLDDFVDMLNGFEASIVKMKRQVEKLSGTVKGSTKLPFDVSKIAWQDKEGEKGKFQLSENYNNPEHKELLKFLDTAGGKITSDGWFYWIFQNGSTIGRKEKKAKA